MAVLCETEAGFTRAVLELAKLYGWRSAHFRPAVNRRGHWSTAVQGDGAGFPDLVLVHPKRKRVLFVELKTNRGRRTPGQIAWSIDLTEARAAYRLWRPCDWPEIEATLKGKRT